jgi:hypothetical protein
MRGDKQKSNLQKVERERERDRENAGKKRPVSNLRERDIESLCKYVCMCVFDKRVSPL